MSKVILDLCGGTGAWSKPYKEAGYDVRLITLPEHDVRTYKPPENVYGILAAPPCTMFSFARARNTNLKNPRNLKEGMEIVLACLNIIWESQYSIKTQADKKTTLSFWALENPNGFLKHFLGKSVFKFNPYDFGDLYKKRTDLWGWFNDPRKTCFVKPNVPKFGYDKTIKSNKESRSITPPGFARAFYVANK